LFECHSDNPSQQLSDKQANFFGACDGTKVSAFNERGQAQLSQNGRLWDVRF
jgi:hypothetical protein